MQTSAESRVATSVQPRAIVHKLIAETVVFVLLWWFWHPIGASFALLVASYARKLIVDRAAFWEAQKIFAVGLLWGAGMALAVRELVGIATSSHLISVLLLLEGFIAVQYVG